MIQEANKYVCSILWPCLTFELKITVTLKSIRWGLEMSELLWEQLAIGVFPVELLA